MRVAPVGMYAAHLIRGRAGMLAETFRVGSDACAITHGHPTGYLSGGVLAVVIALLHLGESLPAAIASAKLELRVQPKHGEVLEAIERAEELARTQPERAEALTALGEGWVAEEALAIALYCALCARDFESGIVLAVNHDGDSDSTGAIAGNVLGAMLGIDAIPARWLEPLELRSVLEEIADDLAAAPDWDLTSTVEREYYQARYPPA